VKDGSPVIDIHIRISRRFVLWFVVLVMALFVLWLMMTALSGGAGAVEIGPARASALSTDSA
jgi:hypothetical protein